MKIHRVDEATFLNSSWHLVEFVQETSQWLEYHIFGRTVWIYKDDRKPHCTCDHGSLWSVNKAGEICKHIKLVRKAVAERKKWTWDWWECDKNTDKALQC